MNESVKEVNLKRDQVTVCDGKLQFDASALKTQVQLLAAEEMSLVGGGGQLPGIGDTAG